MKPPVAGREETRLAVLRSYGIFGTLPEPSYDDIVGLAATFTGTRFAAIAIIGEASVWVKAATHPTAREIPLAGDGPCAHVVQSGEPLVVLDAHANTRFRVGPLTDDGSDDRFWAGVPIVNRAGYMLGVLFVADSEPRPTFPDSHVVALRKFSRLASAQMESRQAVDSPDSSAATDGVELGWFRGSARRFEALTNLIPQIVWSTTPDGYHDYFNERWFEYTGMPRTGDQGWSWKDYLHPDDVDRTADVWQRALATGEPYDVVYRFRRAEDGEYRWFIGRAIPMRDASGEIARWFGTCTDVHEERRADQKLARLEDFRRAVMSLVEDSLTARHAEDFFQRVLDRAVSVIPGAEAGSVLLRAPDGLFDFVASLGFDLERLRQVRLTQSQVAFGRLQVTEPENVAEYSGGMPTSPEHREVMETAGRIHEIKMSLSIPVVLDGTVTAHVSLNNFQSSEAFGEEAIEMGRIFAGYVATLVQRFRMERELHRLAYEDVLTELPNRASIDARIREAFERADASGGRAAILFLDLDGFKAINDTFGHRAGDEVLQVVGRRLAGCTRAGEAVGRFGGDEFALILHGRDVEQEARVVAERALEAVTQPIVMEDGTVRVTGSIGIAIYPVNGRTSQEVMQSADMAMYRAKDQGSNAYAFFERESAVRSSG